MERDLVRCRDGNTNDVKQNTGQNNTDQNHKGQHKSRTFQKIRRHKTHQGRNQNSRQKDQRDPFEIWFSRFTGLFLFRSSQDSLHINYVNLILRKYRKNVNADKMPHMRHLIRIYKCTMAAIMVNLTA